MNHFKLPKAIVLVFFVFFISAVSFVLISRFSTKRCGKIIPPDGFELAKLERGPVPEDASFSVDFKGDKDNFLVQVYNEHVESLQPFSNHGRSKPIITRVYSEVAKNCYQQVYEFIKTPTPDQDRSGNELYYASLMKNLFKDSKDAFLVINESTGYGSGFDAFMNIIRFNNGKFELIEGPTIGELSFFKISESNIIVARGIWGENEAHFDDHRYQIEKYTWENSKYSKQIVGTTIKKYNLLTSQSVDDILFYEPQIVITDPI